MASELAAYFVSIVPSAKGLTGKIAKEFSGIDREASKTGKTSGAAFSNAFKGSMAGIAGALAAVGIGSFLKSAVDGAGQLEQSIGAIESVFKGSSAQMKDWSRKAARDVGLTSNEFNELGTLIGSQLKNGGTAMEDLAPKTKNLIGVGADLASMFGGTTKEAIEAMSSALRGESDPIERYGVSLSAARIEAKALEQGAKKVGGELSQQAKQTAILALITEQTADAQGNFARESDTFAHKQQVMAAEWGNLTTKMGELFLPTLTTVFSFISEKAIPVLTEVVGGVRAFGAAWVANDGDITSSGFPGFMEDLAFTVRHTFDEMGKLAQKFWDMRVPIGIIIGLIVTALIPHWVALAVEALKSAAKQKAAWVITRVEAAKSALAHSGAVTAMVAGWALLAAQATIQSIKIAAAWFVAMGPVGWAIGAIVGIGAAIWAAYENVGWFRDGVDAAFKWVGDAVAAAFEGIKGAIGAVVNWFTGTAIPAWDSAVKSVGDFFSWLYESAIKPVFDGIAAVITWVYESVIKPVFDGIATIVNGVIIAFQGIYNFLKPVFDSIAVIVGGFYMFFEGVFNLVVAFIRVIIIPLFMTFWNSMVEAFTGIGTAISSWWNGTVLPVFNAVIGFVRDTLGAVFTWLINDVIRPVFNGISAVITWVWNNVLKPMFNAWVALFRDVLAPAFKWLYENVIRPVFNGIGNAIKWVWDNILKPMFNAWVSLFRDVLGPAFTWLHENIIKPAFDGIGNAIKWVWEKVIKPVFDTLSNFITKTIPKAFEDGVKFVKKAWDGLQEVAKAPVRFVIDTVINDGLIKGFNDLARPLGVKELGRVALPAGFADGGYTGTGGKYQPAGIVHAGEVVWSQDDISRWGGVGVVEAMRKAAGFAKGGIVNPLKQMALTQGYNRVHKGIDLAAAVGTPVFASQGGRVSWAGPGARGPGVWGGNEVHVAGNGIETWFAHLSQIGVKLGQQVRAGQQIGLSGNTGISSGPHLHFGTFNGGWPNDIDPMAYLGGAGIPSGGGFNPIAGIIDGLMSKIKEAGGGPFADIAIGIGKKVIDSASKFVTDFLSGNHDKGSATATLYDGGGWLENTGGAQLVQHNKRKPDAVLSSGQWDTMTRIADNAKGGFNNYGTIHVRDEEEAARIFLTRQRDAQAAYGF